MLRLEDGPGSSAAMRFSCTRSTGELERVSSGTRDEGGEGGAGAGAEAGDKTGAVEEGGARRTATGRRQWAPCMMVEALHWTQARE